MPTPIQPVNGVISGKFKIPKNTFRAGTKRVIFKGSAGGTAETTFTGQGSVVTNTMRNVHNIQQSYYDPLAQTFMLTVARQIVAVDLWVMVKGTTPLIVQLRETSVGFPTRTIIAEGRMDPSDPQYVTGAWTRIKFDTPFYASANIEYAVVVLANDATTEVAISSLGKPNAGPGGGYVTQQPYQVGVLLSSSNASTWTTHQDKDLTFQLVSRKYDGQPLPVTLGQITLAPGTTDLLISALTQTPATGADADLVLYQFDPAYPGDVNQAKTKLTVSDGQVVKFTQATSGDFTVIANLRCTEHASATIQPGSQIIQGIMSSTAEYITRNIPAWEPNSAKGTNVTVKVTLETIGGGSVAVDYAPSVGTGAGGAIVAADWKPLTLGQVGSPLASGRKEYPYSAQILAADVPQNIKLRVTLTGTAAERPQVFNLRASIINTPQVTP
ncbi:hypothetical protein EU642_22110 [Salmonella enterica]|nr:hypothetical protein [Salmonella enterica]EAO0118549.1 hypothetical protein [Salmonella enterica]EAO3601654.1 hypothetical protein [Salmonella enterica]EAR6391547.1 hypothetical protein [Salmonella enterica]EAV1285311.1 hypothetical protein [Salmonella enterica]